VDRNYQTELLQELLNMPEGQPVIEKMDELADKIVTHIPLEKVEEWNAMTDRTAAWDATMEYLLDMFEIRNSELRDWFKRKGG
jgi:hypothetical protein